MVPEEVEVWGGGGSSFQGGHEATDTGFAYAPVSQAHGHHHFRRGGGVLHITEWMCKRFGSSMAAKAATFPWTSEMLGPPPSWIFAS